MGEVSSVESSFWNKIKANRLKLLRSIGKCLSLLLGLGLIQAVGLQAQPAAWNPVLTGQDHTLVISQGSILELDGDPLPLGSWLGAFFSLPNGGLQCAGMVEWKGTNTVLPIYGANGTMPPLGFATGEAFKFRLWLPGDSCIIDSLTVTYQSGGVFTHQGAFAANGLSGLASLRAYTGLQLDLGADTSLCEGQGLLLRGGCCAQSYLWSTGDSSSRIVVSDSGQYSLTMLSAAGCSKRDTLLVDVIASPSAQWQWTGLGCDTTRFEAQPQDGATYRWDFGDGNLDSGRSVTHVYASFGIYTVELWVENECGIDSSRQEVVVACTDLDKAASFPQPLLIFPQPAQHMVWLEVPYTQPVTVQLFNLTGRQVASWQFRDLFQADLSAFPSGMYYLRFFTPSGHFVNKTLLIKK
jgi:hypothetical protein